MHEHHRQHALVTLRYTQGGTRHWGVAEAVDNSNPTNAVTPDAFRVSFAPTIHRIGTSDCWTPTIPPVPISPSAGGADIRVEP